MTETVMIRNDEGGSVKRKIMVAVSKKRKKKKERRKKERCAVYQCRLWSYSENNERKKKE